MFKKLFIIIVLVIVLINQNILSEAISDEQDKKEKIIVTATKTEEKISDVAASVTVITEEEISRYGYKSAIGVLQGTPGLTISQNSVYGGQAGVYLRGINKPGHTLVLVDGMEMNDPISTDKFFDFANLTTDNIERIEVIRGSQSTLYGSDAIGGVINIITKKGKDKPVNITFFAEAGSFSTFKEHLGISGILPSLDYSLVVSRIDTQGISKAAQDTNIKEPFEKDAYHNTTISSRIGVQPVKNLKFNLFFRYTTAEFDVDDDFLFEDDLNRINTSENLNTKVEIEHLLSSWWDHKISYAYMNLDRTDKDKPDELDILDLNDSRFKGSMQKAEWQNNFYLTSFDTLTGGIEYELEQGSFYTKSAYWDYWQSFVTNVSEFKKKEARNIAGYLQNQFVISDLFSATAGVRLDNHEIFKNDINYKLSLIYNLDITKTRFKGNYGTGFKAPSLYQLFSSYGSLELKPEENVTYDLGFEQSFFTRKIIFNAVVFYHFYRNLIDFDFFTFTYNNISHAETKGCEIDLSIIPIKTILMNLSYTYSHAKDLGTDTYLIKVPFNQGKVNFSWDFISKANAFFDIMFMGERKDFGNTELDSFLTLNLGTSYFILEKVQLFGRVENLLDKEYQVVYGYAMPGRAFYGGVKANF